MCAKLSDKLAIDGGPKVRNSPFPQRHLFGRQEKLAVMRLFDRAIEHGDKFLAYQGAQEEAYCKEFTEFLGGGYADGVNSGTNALYVALRALEIEPGSEIIVPPISDPGGVMPVVIAGCVPIPADSAPGSYNIGAKEIEARVTGRTRAVIVAHIAGLPADMAAIMKVARTKHLFVIEDCAQAHGAKYKGKYAGTFGHLAAFSMMFGKHHATGGQGGMVFTKDEELYRKVRRYADRGKPFGIENAAGNVVAALNCNMDELHAAIGRTQLRKLPGVVARRRKIAASIAAGCKELKTVRPAPEPPGCESACWFISFELRTDLLRVGKAEFVNALAAEGIKDAIAGYGHFPVRMPWHTGRRAFGSSSQLPWSLSKGGGRAAKTPKTYALPNAEAAAASQFILVLHERWTAAEVKDTLAAFGKVERACLR